MIVRTRAVTEPETHVPPDFNCNFDAPYEAPHPIARGIVQVLAQNPKDYTFRGTNSFLVGETELAIIDPGPLLDSHIDALMKAVAGRPVRAILVTHSHRDHSPAAAALSQLTDAPVMGHRPIDAAIAALTTEDVDLAFAPDRELTDQDSITIDGRVIRAVHTPGHFPNHLCYALEQERILFSGDQVMGWSTTVISPPLGNLEHYLNSLDALLTRDDRLYLPSHGPKIDNPHHYVRQLIEHRHCREQQIIACLQKGCRTPAEIVSQIYTGLTPRLVQAAQQSVQAHLDYLTAQGLLGPGNVYHPRPTESALRPVQS
ncbi:MBL fold metallo-hydrolase [Iodidimonas muriae]|uniref:MBL fold metallo-hydrolase n=1 Tax=Iodidimonas muriae TaxID=261467 RepID=A0ABQ2LBX6_9PROT|nr:MBL fold metallo-hydrolase [Iodidimonas muriae]GER06835.1 MBL fold metallo-hydrolase [Kordiimonadales bacterium JCM 17843]GGO09824.1 MBL fold metallo-hydrolase [Iodidimonas muriae]